MRAHTSGAVKPPKRMAHDDYVPSFADRINHGVLVLPPAGRLVLARKIDR